ncbi:uncharacterized protein [Periplaneta americana]|uniref:uncharacterized protein n=1 Tax=Periplaneta americana TaxID=6978 RepID=UPI0037E9409C
MDHMLQLAAAKLGLLGVVKALGAGILSKLPLLLALPVGLLVLALPLLLALFLPIPIFSHHGGSEECSSDCDGKTRRPQVEERISRALAVLVESEACVGRMACELGALNSKSQYKNAVTWLLSHMQRSAPESEQGLLAVYRTAYVKGNEGYSCSNGQYLCDLAPVITAAFES